MVNLENIVEGFENYLPGLFTLFGNLLQDPESLEVRITTVRHVLDFMSPHNLSEPLPIV